VAAAVAELGGLADGAVERQREAVTERRPPRGRPVHHERHAGGGSGSDQRAGAGEIGGHGLFDHHGQAAPQRAHAELGRCPVVGEDEDGVEVAALEEGVERLVRRDAAVRALQLVAQARIGIGGGDEAAVLAGVQRGEVAPHVIVAQPEHSDIQTRHRGHRTACVTSAAAADSLRRATLSARSLSFCRFGIRRTQDIGQ
jgi:hypothetical protein